MGSQIIPANAASIQGRDMETKLKGDLDLSLDDVRAKIIQEIAALEPEPIQPDEFTLRQYAKELGATRDSARRQVDRLVERGILAMRGNVLINGKRCNVYRRTEKGKVG